MSNLLTDDTKSIILLCAVLGKERCVRPLTQTEYNKVVRWLVDEQMRPEDLLQYENVGSAAIGTGIDQERLKALLGRGIQLGFAVEEWQRNGIWIISRSDKDYPARYKKHLKDKAPPLLFGVGDRSLLFGGGIAIVGSRNVDKDGEAFTREVAKLCAYNGMPVVSGGARGVDQISMTASLEAGGITIGVLAENLLRKSLERISRNAIADGRLLMISSCHPNARFTVGTAMGRNKLIYSMADYGLVVSSDHKKGGTWAGATEELKRKNPRAIFVRSGVKVPLGNIKLLDNGALKWPKVQDGKGLRHQLDDIAAKRVKKYEHKDLSIFDYQELRIAEAGESKKIMKTEISSVEPIKEDWPGMKPEKAIYEAVLPVIMHQMESPTAVGELSKTLKVSKPVLNRWVKRALNEGKIRKLSRPVRYEKIKVASNMDGK